MKTIQNLGSKTRGVLTALGIGATALGIEACSNDYQEASPQLMQDTSQVEQPRTYQQELESIYQKTFTQEETQRRRLASEQGLGIISRILNIPENLRFDYYAGRGTEDTTDAYRLVTISSGAYEIRLVDQSFYPDGKGFIGGNDEQLDEVEIGRELGGPVVTFYAGIGTGNVDEESIAKIPKEDLERLTQLYKNVLAQKEMFLRRREAEYQRGDKDLDRRLREIAIRDSCEAMPNGTLVFDTTGANGRPSIAYVEIRVDKEERFNPCYQRFEQSTFRPVNFGTNIAFNPVTSTGINWTVNIDTTNGNNYAEFARVETSVGENRDGVTNETIRVNLADLTDSVSYTGTRTSSNDQNPQRVSVSQLMAPDQFGDRTKINSFTPSVSYWVSKANYPKDSEITTTTGNFTMPAGTYLFVNYADTSNGLNERDIFHEIFRLRLDDFENQTQNVNSRGN